MSIAIYEGNSTNNIIFTILTLLLEYNCKNMSFKDITIIGKINRRSFWDLLLPAKSNSKSYDYADMLYIKKYNDVNF